jgi:ATP-dependent helicase HrpB
MIPLPIDPHLPPARAALGQRGALVLTADPGAGKSTRLPPALLPDVAGDILLLQPRRIAARSLAARIADEQGWRLGDTVGYRVRHERVGGRGTRLWVMTEGTLTRRLADDPYLEGVGCVILDEFHERSLHTDLALAWCAELRRTVRPDLRLVVMSATMDPAPVATFLDGATVAVAAPRFPVELIDGPTADLRHLAERTAEAVREAARRPEAGDILVFLPGMGEIRATAALLPDDDLAVLPLHGSLPPDEQDRALRPADRRKVVLATNVAETSLTIPGIRTVIDTGLARVNRYDPDRGFDDLVLEPISLAAAGQRAGRAGRTAPGRCIRLYSPLTRARMAAASDPELTRVDLAPFALTLKSLHGPDPRTFPWFQAPEPQRLETACALLDALGASAGCWGGLTALGIRLAQLPLHPRLGRLLLDAETAGAGPLGAGLAAVIGGRDLRRPRRREDPPADPGPSDLLDRLDLLERAPRHPGIDLGAVHEARRTRDELLRLVRGGSAEPEPDQVARLALAAFPDRVCVRAAPDANRAAMCGGVSVTVDEGSALFARRGQARTALFVAVGLQGLSSPGRSAVAVRLGCELPDGLLATERRDRLSWDAGRQRVESHAGWWWRDLCVKSAGGAQADPEAVANLLAQHLAAEASVASAVVRSQPEAAAILDRLAWLAAAAPDLAPAMPDLAQLVRDACAGCRSRDEVAAKPWPDLLHGALGWNGRQALDRLAPDRITVPTGNRIRLDYGEPGQPPVLAVRLQELFGLAETPTVADGRVRVLLHLLGPNYRPEQITDDLAGFWTRTYPQVRKDLRGRYPKHSWPDDPLSAPPVAKGRPRP